MLCTGIVFTTLPGAPRFHEAETKPEQSGRYPSGPSPGVQLAAERVGRGDR